nr:hypothetical protein Iba_chr15cCG7600 [Ipomoea batatas]
MYDIYPAFAGIAAASQLPAITAIPVAASASDQQQQQKLLTPDYSAAADSTLAAVHGSRDSFSSSPNHFPPLSWIFL